MKMFLILLNFMYIVHLSSSSFEFFESSRRELKFAKNPAPDGHRCGVCPTYFDEVCAYDRELGRTIIFDNHCVMDLYNCLQNTTFFPFKRDNCVFFGNFGYVHGLKTGPLVDDRK